LLNSAVANVPGKTDNFFISKITVDEGPVMKRVLPRAKGKGDVIKKRSSHVTLVLDEIKKEKINESIKVHPKVFRIKGINDWQSHGYYGKNLRKSQGRISLSGIF